MTVKLVLQQLKADLIGKDSYRGVTLSYAWLANQLGHFTLGFLPPHLYYHFYEQVLGHPSTTSSLVVATVVAAIWLLFELYNFLIPILSAAFANRSKSAQNEKFVFRPPWLNIAFDTFTDLCFFWIGAYSFSVGSDTTPISKVILILVSILAIIGFCYWYPVKIVIQNAQFPFQFRLSQWNKKISVVNKEKAIVFLRNTPMAKGHLLIFGNKNKGKSSLAVGLSTECAFKQHKCYFTTASKLLDELTSATFSEITGYWQLEEADIVVVDDMNPSLPIEDEVISANNFELMIMCVPHLRERNKGILQQKTFIWVLGSQFKTDPDGKKWVEMLGNCGVEKRRISMINLSEN